MEWISVSERPMLKDECILAIWKGAICFAKWDDDRNEWEIFINFNCLDGHFYVPEDMWHKFYYWMPLPKHPSEYYGMD